MAAVRASATEFKQHVGKYLDAARTGRVVIEKQNRPVAVLISVEEYEALNPGASQTIDTLSEEFDALVSRMQQPSFHKAMQTAFDAGPTARCATASTSPGRQTGRSPSSPRR